MVTQPGDEVTDGETARRSVRAELQDVVDRLIEDYRDQIPAGSIIRCVARCTETATRSGVPRPALATVVERLARARLDARSRTGSPVPRQIDLRTLDGSAPDRIPDQPLGATDEPCG